MILDSAIKAEKDRLAGKGVNKLDSLTKLDSTIIIGTGNSSAECIKTCNEKYKGNNAMIMLCLNKCGTLDKTNDGNYWLNLLKNNIRFQAIYLQMMLLSCLIFHLLESFLKHCCYLSFLQNIN